MDKSIRSFIKFVRTDLKPFDIKLRLMNRTRIQTNGFECSGYFNPTDKRIVVAKKMDNLSWLGVLAHEYCHAKQFIEDCPPWRNCYDEYGNDYGVFVDQWLTGEDFADSLIRKAIRAIRDMELDNERRTVEVIKEHNLPLDLDEYKKYAACYIFFHMCMLKTRKWFRIGYSMRSDPNIIKYVESSLEQDFDVVPADLMNYFETKCL